MKDINLSYDDLIKIIDMMENQFGPHSEIVLHDLRTGYDSTIVDIRNSHITRRKVGGCGTNIGLEVIKDAKKTGDGDEFNYTSYTRDGKILRSSSIYFHEPDGKVWGALCINTDVTDTLKFEAFLHDFNQCAISTKDKDEEVFADNVSDLLDYFIQTARQLVDKPEKEWTKQDKLVMLQYLDSKGAMLITKSSERLCEELSISKFTLYNYLDIIRNGNSKCEA